MNDPQLIMLCGIPTSGKSTYVENHLLEVECFDYTILSTDSLIEGYARDNGTTYDEAFNLHIKNAQRLLTWNLGAAIGANQNIIWDQTNLTPKARKGKLALVPAHYKKTAVWFNISLEDAMIRNQTRPGKIIPPPVLKSMFRSFIPPALHEGFDKITRGN